jgi:polar amino acid transport system substrate-binding protein
MVDISMIKEQSFTSRLIAAIQVLIISLTLSLTALSTQAAPKDVLRVGVWEDAPFVMRDKDGTWTGITYLLWHNIAKSMQIPYKIKVYSHHELIEALHQGTVDVGLSNIPVTEKNVERFALSRTYLHSYLTIANRLQETSTFSRILKTMASPSVLTILGIVLLLIVGGSVVFWVLEKRTNTHMFEPEHKKFKFFNGIMWSILLLTAQEGDVFKNRSLIGRVFSIVLLFIGVTLSASYVAIITSSLTVSTLTSKIHGVEDLPFIRVAALTDTRATDYLTEYNIKHTEFETLRSAITALENKQIDVVVADDAELGYFTRHQYDKTVTVLPVSLETEYYALAFPRNSPLADTINPAISKFIESRQWKELLRRYLGQNRGRSNGTY